MTFHDINEKLELCKCTNDKNVLQQSVDFVYDSISLVLTNAVTTWVPCTKKTFYKFWWDEELKSLKAASVKSNNLWKAAGKPRRGPIFEKRQKCRVFLQTPISPANT